jgi:hypothetical protein
MMDRTYTVEHQRENNGWRLRLYEDGEEAGGGVFPDNEGQGQQDAENEGFFFVGV